VAFLGLRRGVQQESEVGAAGIDEATSIYPLGAESE